MSSKKPKDTNGRKQTVRTTQDPTTMIYYIVSQDKDDPKQPNAFEYFNPINLIIMYMKN